MITRCMGFLMFVVSLAIIVVDMIEWYHGYPQATFLWGLVGASIRLGMSPINAFGLWLSPALAGYVGFRTPAYKKSAMPKNGASTRSTHPMRGRIARQQTGETRR